MLKYKQRILIMFVLLFVVCSLPVSAREQILKIGMDVTDMNSFSLLDGTSAQDGTIRAAIYEKLVDYAVPGTVTEDMVPKLAVSWEHSDDFKVWTFKLRQGVQFHGGYGEMTAEDVKYTLDRMRKDSTQASLAHHRDVEIVNVIDKYTIEIVLKNSEPRFIGKIGQSALGYHITSKKAFEELGEDMKTNPIGTGPFEFVEYKSNNYSKIKRFDDYWGDKKAMLDEVIIYYMPSTSARNIAIQNGDVHVIRGVYDATWKAMMENIGMTFDMLGPGFSSMMFFNRTVKPIDNHLIREAIAYAINREEIGIVFGAGPQTTPIPSTWLFHTKEDIPVYEYDLEKSKAKLAEAGYPNGIKIGPQYVTESSFYKNQMEVIQAQLARAGIDLQMVIVDHATYHQYNREGINPLALFGNGHYDGQYMFFAYFHSSAGEVNYGRYYEIDDLLDSTLGKSADEIFETLKRVQQKVVEDLVLYTTIEAGIPLARRPEVDLGYEPVASIIGCYPVTVDTHLKD